MKAFLTIQQAISIAKRHEQEAEWDFWALTEAQIWAELLILEVEE